MTQPHLALLCFMAGSLMFFASTFPAVEAAVWERRWLQRFGTVSFIFGSLLLW